MESNYFSKEILTTPLSFLPKKRSLFLLKSDEENSSLLNFELSCI